jgi:hypothetical protein
MVDWSNKVMKSVGHDLGADEQLMSALLMQPAGTTKKMVLGGVVGGAIGAAVAAASQKKGAGTEAGSVADGFPNPPIVLGVTSRRVLVWSFSQLSGKPKELLGAIPVASVAGVTVGTGRLSRPFTIEFVDGSVVHGEAPTGTDPDGFRDAITRYATT